MEEWQDPITPFVWLGIGSLLLLFFVVSLFVFYRIYRQRLSNESMHRKQLKKQYQRALISTQIDAQESERTRIAGELHDDLIGQLRGIQLMNEDNFIKEKIKTTIRTARLISHDLNPAFFEELELPAILSDYLIPYKLTYAVNFECPPFTSCKLTRIQKLHLFRIVQEVITNIDKHANANKISVVLEIKTNVIILSISNDGLPYIASSTKGIGLKNIERRAQLIDAEYTLKQGTHKGSIFRLKLKNTLE